MRFAYYTHRIIYKSPPSSRSDPLAAHRQARSAQRRRVLERARVHRHVDRQRRAAAGGAVDLDAAAMAFGDAAHIRQPYAPAAFFAILRRLRAAEDLEDGLQLFGWNRIAFVVHGEQHAGVAAVDLDAYGSVSGAI